MGRLQDARGRWLEADMDKVSCLVAEVFVGLGEGGNHELEGVDYEECPLLQGKIELSVRQALGRTKNGSAPGPERIGYQLIKGVRDPRLGRDLIEEVVDNLV